MEKEPYRLGELVMWNFTPTDYVIGMIIRYHQYSYFIGGITYDIQWLCYSENPEKIMLPDYENELPHDTIKALRDNYLEWRKSL